MPDFLTALLWALTLLLSLAGWGRLAQRLANLPTPTLPDWLDTPSLGLATLACLGGILNLLHLANARMLLAIGIAGVLALLPDLNRRRPQNLRSGNGPSLPSWLLLASVLILLALRFLSAIVLSAPDTPGVMLNPHDDMHSYLVSVARLLQTGTLGLDPFNDRLMVSGLGAQNFLNALGIAPLPFDSIHIADNGLGLTAVTLSAAAFGLRIGLARSAAVSLMLVPLAVSWQIANISANLTAAALLVALASSFMAAMSERAGKLRSLTPTALLLAGVCALKSTMIPGTVIFLGVAVPLVALLRRSPTPLVFAGKVAVFAFLLDLPWMLWQYSSSGTFLYPLLGRGFHTLEPASPLATAFTPEVLAHMIVPAILLAASAVAAWRFRRAASAVPLAMAVALLAAWGLAWPIFAYTTQFPDIGRYLLPIEVPAIIVFLAAAAAVAFQIRRPALAAVPLVLFLLFTYPEWLQAYGRDLPHNLHASITYPARPWGAEATRLHQLQQSIPAGEPFLVYLATPAFLDFNRNPIDVIDWPGETSPPPGLPIDAGPDAVAAYLLSVHIRYVAYSHAGHANFPPDKYGYLLEPGAGRAYNRFAANSFAFQKALTELARTRKTIYHDANDLVIDLKP